MFVLSNSHSDTDKLSPPLLILARARASRAKARARARIRARAMKNNVLHSYCKWGQIHEILQ